MVAWSCPRKPCAETRIRAKRLFLGQERPAAKATRCGRGTRCPADFARRERSVGVATSN
jgi:hypothetical protein